MPDKETAISILTEALHKLKETTPSPRLTPTVKEFLFRIGTSSDDFSHRLFADNLWLFEGIAKQALTARKESNAMIHTTIVPTIIAGGVKDNVIPSNATAIINSRILTGETMQSVEDFLRSTIQDDRVKVKIVSHFGSDPSTVTPINSSAYQRVEEAVYSMIPNVLPTPYLVVGGTDSRYYRKLSDGVVNFLPMTDGKGFHGINERLPLLDLQRGIHFIQLIIEESQP